MSGQARIEEYPVNLLFYQTFTGNIVEYVNQELGKFFQIFIKDNHAAWAYYVPLIQEIINQTCHNSTEMTPYELHFNQRPARPWTKWIIKPSVPEEDQSYERKVELAAERIRKRDAS